MATATAWARKSVSPIDCVRKSLGSDVEGDPDGSGSNGVDGRWWKGMCCNGDSEYECEQWHGFCSPWLCIAINTAASSIPSRFCAIGGKTSKLMTLSSFSGEGQKPMSSRSWLMVLSTTERAICRVCQLAMGRWTCCAGAREQCARALLEPVQFRPENQNNYKP